MGRAPLPKLKESKSFVSGPVKLPVQEAVIRDTARKSAAKIRKEIPPATLSQEELPSAQHPLIKAASKRLHQPDGWPEHTQLRSAPKEVLNLSVTYGALGRALAIADALLKELTKRGFSVAIDSSKGATVITSPETATTLQFSLIEYVRRTRHEITPAEERAQKKYWSQPSLGRVGSYPHIPMYDYTPTGVLTIQVGDWPSRTWKDTPRTQLEKRLGEVIAGISALAMEKHARELEEARRKEAHRRAVERFEFLTKRRSDEVERFKQLESAANDWKRAKRLREFADAVEAEMLSVEEISQEKADWLAWVRAKADWLDPLIKVSDPILDAPEPKKPGYW